MGDKDPCCDVQFVVKIFLNSTNLGM